MKTRLPALVAAIALGAAAVTPALAFDRGYEGQPRYMGYSAYGEDAPVIIVDEGGPHWFGCSNSAAEGNANQQTRPVPQYGQTSGGSAC